jgi:glycosyltransferase involved in cell wall biosynthesis
MAIEASILMAISQFDIQRDSLLNTLHSIARQEVPFPFEICVVDDCSGLDIDKFIKKFFAQNTPPNLERVVVHTLKEKAGFTRAPAEAIKLVSPESQKMVILASDSILLQNMAISELCSRLEPKKVVFSEVAEVSISYDFYSNFEVNANMIINNWVPHLSKIPYIVSRNIPNAWLFFVGAALKEDLLAINYDEVSCDAVLWQKMMPLLYNAEILTYIRSVHQSHVRSAYPCPRVAECKYYCSRTQVLKGTPHPSIRTNAQLIALKNPDGDGSLQAPPCTLDRTIIEKLYEYHRKQNADWPE